MAGLLQEDGGNEILPAGLLAEQLAELADRQSIFCRYNALGERVIYAAPFYYAEKGCAEKLLALVQSRLFLFSRRRNFKRGNFAGEKLNWPGADPGSQECIQNGDGDYRRSGNR